MQQKLENIIAKSIGSLTLEEKNLIIYNAIHFPEGVKGALWREVIMRAVDEERIINGSIDALSLLGEAYKEFDRVYPNLFDEKSILLKQACMLCLKENNHTAAQDNMKKYLYNALAQVHYHAKNERIPYFSFRSFSQYSLDDIANETISLAHPREFNDPLDTILIYWLENEINRTSLDELQLRYRLLMKKVAEHIKIRCLVAGTKDDGTEMPIEELNVLMWSHYANSHKGFCVKYEFGSEMFSVVPNQADKIQLVNEMTYSKAIDLNEEPSIRMALFEKSDFWKEEHEMRFLSFDCSGDDKEFPTIYCPGAVKAIYLGVKCSDADRRAMEKAIGDKNIPLYQMSVDETKLTRLKKTLIG